MRVLIFISTAIMILALLFWCTGRWNRIAEQGPSPPLPPSEAMEEFQLHEDLEIQLVASEPLVQDPVVISFDQDGRLWVVEMRGFMPDIEGEGEKEPVGRISILQDTNGDGKMDDQIIYLDSLIMPRALAIVGNGALVVENMALWWTEDLDGDLRADHKELIDPDYAGNDLPEHSGNGLLRGLDNWYYNAKSRFRYRQVNGKWTRDSTEFRGQWGISQDNAGRLVYNYNWSQLHADLVPPNYLHRNPHHEPTSGLDHGLTVDRRIFPIRPNPAINRGYIPGILDDDGKLTEFTSACAPFYYRGTALPEKFQGNVFVCEPSGNLVKRNQVNHHGIYMDALDPHPGREFLASRDERFRPVNQTSGPDGALYIADMYRGLVQHGAYISPYLKEITLERNLVYPINMGRIYRIVPKGWTPSQIPKLSTFSPQQLVETLNHADGWFRDNAQRLLVESGDISVVPSLNKLAMEGPSLWGQLHALWTLEGLGQTDPGHLLGIIQEKGLSTPLVAANALRILEPYLKDNSVWLNKSNELFSSLLPGAPVEFCLQVVLSLGVVPSETSIPLLVPVLEKYLEDPLFRDAAMSSIHNGEYQMLLAFMGQASTSKISDREIFVEMLASSIGKKGEPSEMIALLALLEGDEDLWDWHQEAIFNGLASSGAKSDRPPIFLEQPLIGTLEKGSSAKWKQVASHFDWHGKPKEDPGETGSALALNEAEQMLFSKGRQYYLSSCSGCHGNKGEGVKRMGPPLANSEWVTGDKKQLSMIVLHGMEGPVEVDGKLYDAPDILPVMPAHSSLDDRTIASILTYIRNEWGHEAGAIDSRFVAITRNTMQGRVDPWRPDELKEYIARQENEKQ
jgi:mono/diheme cytochrome c family protein/glucose/arabinose dehydrogenase